MDDLPRTIAQTEPGKGFTNGNLRSSGLPSRELNSVHFSYPVPSLQPLSSFIPLFSQNTYIHTITFLEILNIVLKKKIRGVCKQIE